MNVHYTEVLKLFSSTLGLKKNFFGITISLIAYNFRLILFLNFHQQWKHFIHYTVFLSVFHSLCLIQSITELQSKIVCWIYLCIVSKLRRMRRLPFTLRWKTKTFALLTDHVFSSMLKVSSGTYFWITDIYLRCFSGASTSTKEPFLPTAFHVILHYYLYLWRDNLNTEIQSPSSALSFTAGQKYHSLQHDKTMQFLHRNAMLNPTNSQFACNCNSLLAIYFLWKSNLTCDGTRSTSACTNSHTRGLFKTFL
jgi:hypothetical protein